MAAAAHTNVQTASQGRPSKQQQEGKQSHQRPAGKMPLPEWQRKQNCQNGSNNKTYLVVEMTKAKDAAGGAPAKAANIGVHRRRAAMRPAAAKAATKSEHPEDENAHHGRRLTPIMKRLLS